MERGIMQSEGRERNKATCHSRECGIQRAAAAAERMDTRFRGYDKAHRIANRQPVIPANAGDPARLRSSRKNGYPLSRV